MFRIEEGMILISSPLIEHYIQSKFSGKRYVENVHQELVTRVSIILVNS